MSLSQQISFKLLLQHCFYLPAAMLHDIMVMDANPLETVRLQIECFLLQVALVMMFCSRNRKASEMTDEL